MSNAENDIRTALVTVLAQQAFASLSNEARAALTLRAAREKADECTNAADERASRIMRDATRFDASAVLTDHRYVCMSCKQNTCASVDLFARATHDILRNTSITSSETIDAEYVLCAFDYCASCVAEELFDIARDDYVRAIYVAVMRYEHTTA